MVLIVKAMEVILRVLILRMFLALVLGAGFCGWASAGQVVQLGDAPSGVTLLNQDERGLSLRVDIGSLHFQPVSTAEGDFVLLAVEGFSRSHRIGEPNLPMVNRLLSVPFGCELQAEVTESEMEEIFLADYGLTVPIMPVQPSLSKSQDPAEVPFEYNQELYGRSGYYSLPLTQTSDVGIMRALRLGMVSMAPLEYDPVANSIRVYKRLVIRVDYLHPDWSLTYQMRRDYYSPFYEPVYAQIINYQPPQLLDDLVSYPVKYVIISDRMFESQLQPFIEWKTRKGFNVITAYTDEIGFSNSAIRSYIQGLYNDSDPPEDPAPSFVLLVGDDQQIPAFSHGYHISDLDFCEYTNDHIPEIYYGRFSAQNPSLLQPQIDKTLEYERYLMPDPGFLGEVTMIAGVDAWNAPTYGNGQINYGVNLYFNSDHGIYSNTWLYPASADPGAAAAIIQTVDEGVGFINYTAHGSHGGWSNPSFSSGDVNGLTNAHKYPLAIGNCCLTNTFGDDYSTPCVGEVWLQVENKGAIGYIGGSNSTYWDEDYWWGVGYGPIIGNGPRYEDTGLGAYDGVFHDHGERLTDYYIVNDALIFCGNMAVEESGSGMSDYYWEIYHLMGDPSVMTYLGVPSPNVVEHDEVITLGATTFTVEAEPLSYIGFSKDGVLHGAAHVDESGIVVMEIVPFDEPGAADLVISAQNREPYITTVQVIAPQGPFVVFDSCFVNDIDGNNNGLVDFGESILLGMQLMNVGPDSAFDVSATISSADQYITITDDSESFGDIEGDFGTAFVPDAYAFEVSIDIPDGRVISFEMEITSDLDTTWTSHFTLTAHAPDVEFAEVYINDDQGNGNGIFEAGETVEMIVTLINNGSCLAGSVTGAISEDDEYVTITDADGSFGDLDPSGGIGDNSDDVFIIVANSEYPVGHSVAFDLAVEASGGYTKDLQFVLRSIESFEYSDGGWVGEGVWEWGEPTSGPGGAYDGSKVWGTVLSGDYPINVDDGLETGYYTIEDPSAAFSFYHWYETESNYDGGNVSISFDGGYSWELILPEGDYPDPDVVALDGEPGYSGSSGDWQEAVFNIGDYAGRAVKFRLRFATDGSVQYPGWYIDAVVVSGATPREEGNPDISVVPAFFDVTVEQGSSHDEILTIGNEGDGLLVYGITPLTVGRRLGDDGGDGDEYIDPVRFDPNWGKYITHQRNGDRLIVSYEGPKVDGGSDDLSGPPVTKDFGGPDEFGYFWIDSNEPNGPTFDWVDISGIGEQVQLTDDDNEGPFDLGFQMPFYGNIHNSIRICSNGWLSFTSTDTEYSNDPIPSSSDPNDLVAPFWDDLNPGAGGMIYFYTNGVDTAIVQWDGVPRFFNDGSFTFEAILTSDGDIIYQYLSMNGTLTSNTVGIENSDGSIGLQVVHNSGYVADGLAVLIKVPTFWLFVDPDFGYNLAGESSEFTVTFDATELEIGEYTGYLRILSNDQDEPEIAVECTLTVTDQTDIDDFTVIIPAEFNLDQNYPNPFNAATSIQYGLPEESRVTIEIYDILGRRIETLIDEEQPAGYHTVVWNGEGRSSGMYFYIIQAGDYTDTKKMVLLK